MKVQKVKRLLYYILTYNIEKRKFMEDIMSDMKIGEPDSYQNNSTRGFFLDVNKYYREVEPEPLGDDIE